MNKKATLLFCLLLTQATLHAAPSIARSEDVVKTLAGRYSSHFKNGDVSGDVYWTDNVVEIVPVAPDAAYVRVELSFFNGHMCSISGVSQVDGKKIIYNDQARIVPDRSPCVLSVSRKGSNLLIDDGNGSCSMCCGARGSLTNETLPFASRRPISYMTRLKASKQYTDALEAWQSRQKR